MYIGREGATADYDPESRRWRVRLEALENKGTGTVNLGKSPAAFFARSDLEWVSDESPTVIAANSTRRLGDPVNGPNGSRARDAAAAAAAAPAARSSASSRGGGGGRTADSRMGGGDGGGSDDDDGAAAAAAPTTARSYAFEGWRRWT